MTTQLTRRGILKALGIGAAAALIEEPIRKLWFVGSNAPVGSRIERKLDWRTATTWRMQLHVTEESAFRPRADEVLYSPIFGFRDDVDLGPVGYLDDLEVAAPATWRIDSTEPMSDGIERLLVRQEQDRIWDEVGREGRALPAGWVFQNGSVIQFGGKS